MAYTNNVPQPNQTIAETQPIIQANFGFLENGIGQEHNFDDSGSGADMYHLQTSMPNQALSPALPSGTNGVFFVSGGNPYFFDGTTNWQLNEAEGIITGTFNCTTSFTPIALLPANSVGTILLYNPLLAVSSGQFVTDGTKAYGWCNLLQDQLTTVDIAVELDNNSPSLSLRGRAFAGDGAPFVGTYKYQIFLRPA